jgi:hypothetical protein
VSINPLFLRGNLWLGLVVASTHGSTEIGHVVDGKKATVGVTAYNSGGHHERY